jgi:curved DNA-binding protein
VREGQLIRVAGKGEPGPGGEDGDLYLRVKIALSPEFEVRDHDLWTEVSLAPWEAVLGAAVPVPSLEGPLSVRVPPGARNGQQLRVRGRGLPSPDGSRGDLYAVVTVEVPSQVTEEERALWQKLAERSSFNPRRGSEGKV